MFTEPDDAITRDLMKKVAEDVSELLARTVSLAPPPRMPIVLAATTACVAILTAEIQMMMERSGRPDPDMIILASLLCARVAIQGPGGAAEAFADLAALDAAGRVPPDRKPTTETGDVS